MESLLSKIKVWWTQLLVWLKANMTVVYIVVSVVAAIFILPKLYKMFFKSRRRVRHRRVAIRRPSLRRGKAGTGKGSDYMRRKMARLRAMRRRKRK